MIPLSPIDYYFFRPSLYTIQFVFEYNHPLNPEKIRLAFRQLSESNPIGRFQLDKFSHDDVILKDSGVDVTVHASKETHEPSLTTMEGLLKLIDPVINDFHKPLIKARITETPTKCYLGISFSHILGDGFSFLMFMRSLARVYNGQPLDQIVNHNRSFLVPSPRSPNQNSALQSLYAETGYSKIANNTSRNLIHAQIDFSKDELLDLKQSVKINSNDNVSDNDVIIASLLLKFREHIPLTEDGQLVVRCPVDYRRILPNLPPTYFGNAIKDAVAVFDPNTVATASFSSVVQVIRDAVNKVNPDSINSALKSLDNLRLEQGVSVFKDIGCPGLLVTNLSKLPFQEIDLGFGPPQRFFPATPCPQLGIILPAKDGVTVRISI